MNILIFNINYNIDKFILDAFNNFKLLNITFINNYDQLSNIDFNNFDFIFSNKDFINSNLLISYNIKFILGPNLPIFPNKLINTISNNNCFYIHSNQYILDYWKSSFYSNNLNLHKFIFGIDTNKYNNNNILINSRSKILIYFHNRNIDDLFFITNFLNKNNIDFIIFNLNNNDNFDDFIFHFHNIKYCIYLSSFYSTNFHLLILFSFNIPLLVWDIISIKDIDNRYDKYYISTVLSYWDNNLCGQIFYDKNEFNDIFNNFINHLELYNPRKFILENFTFDICEKNFITLLNKL